MQTPSEHAVARHGNNAYTVARRMERATPADTFCKVGPDGRRYTIRQLPGGKRWDVSIDTADGKHNVTAFTCSSRNWIARKLLWCSLMFALVCGAVCLLDVIWQL